MTTKAETRTVRVVNRNIGPANDTRGYYGVHIDRVTVPWVCCTCGGPRGEPQPYNFCEDGEWLVCDRWTNPCGHVDVYDDVIAQAISQTRSNGASTELGTELRRD
ncbi:MAG: hypothetical protein HY675_25585 [Chloroflexi bacterium]|nr:hypothetical protein [Chloroflexota bacterium]